MIRKKSIAITIVPAAFIALALLPAAVSNEPTHIQQSTDETDLWTFLFYMSGDVPGSPLNWTDDVNEIEHGLFNEDITAVALIDPESIGDSKGYLISHDETDSSAIVSSEIASPPFIPVSGEVNMGDPQTLIQFADFVIENYHKGGRLGIVFWGHGDGWYGVSQDRGDFLEPKEMIESLREIKIMLGSKIDLLVFDACSMGSLEVLPSLSEVANYSVASEIPFPSYGLPYDSIFTRLSIDPSIDTEDVGKIFADEHVKFGALLSGVTSHAAVIELESLNAASHSFNKLSMNNSLFVPIAKEAFLEIRNDSKEVGLAFTIDLVDYLTVFMDNESLPDRLLSMAEKALGELSASVVANRLHMESSDIDQFPTLLSGISIFYPYGIAPGGKYGNTSDVAENWKIFLDRLAGNETFTTPNSGLYLTMQDWRFGDDLQDSAILDWNSTSDIMRWEFDVRNMHDAGDEFTEVVSDSANSLVINYLEPGIYSIDAYGRADNGDYLFHEIFESVKIMKRYQYTIDLAGFVNRQSVQLIITNLENGGRTLVDIDSIQMTLSFDIPEPNQKEDRILIEVVSADDALARGIIILGENEGGTISLMKGRAVSPLVEFAASILVSGLIIFSFIKLMKVGEESGLSAKGLRNRKLAKAVAFLSKSRGNRKV